MRCVINRKKFSGAFNQASAFALNNDKKAVLQNVLFRPGELVATDLDTGIVCQTEGVTFQDSGTVLLGERFGAILRASPDEFLTLSEDGDNLVVAGLHSDFALPTEDPKTFPMPEANAMADHWVVYTVELKAAIRRTVFATDCESTRYALGGCLVEWSDAVTGKANHLSLVGTDGRRLAKADASIGEVSGAPRMPPSVVIPVRTLKLLDRSLEGMGPVQIALSDKGVWFRTEAWTIFSRLLEGRFPRYQDVFPGTKSGTAKAEVGPLRSAIEQASIVTSEESRGIDFAFSTGVLALSSQSSDRGKSKVQCPIEFDGDVTVTMDPRYTLDMLKTLDESESLSIDLIDEKSAVLIRIESGYQYVVMPLTRDGQ